MLATIAISVAGPAGRAEAEVPPPFDGRGMWVWYVSRSGGDAEGLARRAARQRVKTVYVKSGDAGNYWSQFDRRLVDALHARGIRACAWQFVYGSRPLAEAATAARAATTGADCLVIDAETAYEGRYGSADAYVRRLRKLVGPDFPLGLSSFPYVHYHPAFPYSVFLGPGAATVNLPQMYWRAIGTSVPEVYRITFKYNRPYAAPIAPVGQTYMSPRRKEILRFRRFAWEYNRQWAGSWWSWQETSRREFSWLKRRVQPFIPGFEPRDGHARLEIGARGDLVVRAQQLLRAWGYQVRVDGTYGRTMATKVSSFRTSQGLGAGTSIDTRAWRALNQREPAVVRWSGRGGAGAASGRAPGAPRPDSARLPALADELGDGPWRR